MKQNTHPGHATLPMWSCCRTLPPLIEDMARNVHEVWAQNRISEGWTYGPVRDDSLRYHPCLVPYDELPESEKQYDRATSQETTKTDFEIRFSDFKKIMYLCDKP